MLRCRDIVRHGEAFVSGEMRGWRRAGFWLHLLCCRYCRRYIRQLRTTRAVSQALSAADVPAGEELDAVLARILAGTPAPSAGPEKKEGGL